MQNNVMQQHPDATRITNFLKALDTANGVSATNKLCIKEFYNYSVRRGLGICLEEVNKNVVFQERFPVFDTYVVYPGGNL